MFGRVLLRSGVVIIEDTAVTDRETIRSNIVAAAQLMREIGTWRLLIIMSDQNFEVTEKDAREFARFLHDEVTETCRIAFVHRDRPLADLAVAAADELVSIGHQALAVGDVSEAKHWLSQETRSRA